MLYCGICNDANMYTSTTNYSNTTKDTDVSIY